MQSKQNFAAFLVKPTSAQEIHPKYGVYQVWLIFIASILIALTVLTIGMGFTSITIVGINAVEPHGQMSRSSSIVMTSAKLNR
ncbi:MAG: hypothetical protein WA116_02135 [Anaerolineaceae bacterium]